jgi:hypothetical protein
MSTQEQLSKLQGLLQRIQTNASRPRASAPIPAAATFAPAPAPPPFVAAPPVQPYAFAVGPSAADQSVDDLLGAPEASPMPVEVDVPLDTIPPVAEVATAPSETPDAEPIPLVSAGAASPPPQPIEEFGLESEVSEVRVTTSTREPAVEVTVAAIEAEAEAVPVGTEELSDDDLVEVTEGTPPPPATDVDIDFEDETEQPPASSQRSRVASTMDEALAAAAEHESEREVPLKTPPPESGPQEAPMPMGFSAPGAPDVDALLGGELDIPTRADALGTPAGPTTEQLGQTIDLEEARGPSLELAHQVAEEAPAAVPPVEELEVALPGRGISGGYDDDLQPPPEATTTRRRQSRSLRCLRCSQARQWPRSFRSSPRRRVRKSSLAPRRWALRSRSPRCAKPSAPARSKSCSTPRCLSAETEPCGSRRCATARLTGGCWSSAAMGCAASTRVPPP